jgi:hypothetical protein
MFHVLLNGARDYRGESLDEAISIILKGLSVPQNHRIELKRGSNMWAFWSRQPNGWRLLLGERGAEQSMAAERSAPFRDLIAPARGRR